MTQSITVVGSRSVRCMYLQRPGNIADNMADEIKQVLGYLPGDRKSMIVNGNVIITDSCNSNSTKKAIATGP